MSGSLWVKLDDERERAEFDVWRTWRKRASWDHMTLPAATTRLAHETPEPWAEPANVEPLQPIAQPARGSVEHGGNRTVGPFCTLTSAPGATGTPPWSIEPVAPPSNQVRRSLTPKALPTSMQPYRAHELANGNAVGMDENQPPPWF